MSVKSIENSTLGLAQINGADGTPSITISSDGVVALVSPAQATSSDSNAISTIAYVNQSIADASVALDPNGSYIWGGTYNIFGNNQTIGFGSSTLPTVLPVNGQTSSATGLMLGNNANLKNETDLYNFSNTGTGGFDFYNISSGEVTTNYASLYPNAGVPIFNLKGTGGQYQINGTNILDNVITTSTLADYALIASPTFTGIPKAPKAILGTNSTQIATCSFVADAIGANGSFSPNTSYTWGSNYQLYGNDQVLCVGSSLMNTNKPQTGLTSPQQGSQICNNTQIQGETDFVNYSGAGAGGFCFQQMSSTNTLTNLATMYRNGGACILNLPNPSSQFQIGGANILDAVTSKAPLNSPAFTGTPTAPTATAGTSTDQLATTKFVEDAIVASGVFDPNISYTWGSAFQRFGNDQVLCIGSSTMNTTKPVTGFTSTQQGTQICNNTQTRGETDFVNYSASGTGGFAFQQQSSSVSTNTMATMYKSGTATTFNLPNSQSQFQVNGVNIARQTTVTSQSVTVPNQVLINATGGQYKINWAQAPTNRYSSINGTNIVNLGVPTALTAGPLTGEVSFVTTGGVTQATNVAVLSVIYGSAPNATMLNSTFNINVSNYSTGVPISGYGTIIQSTTSSSTYAVAFVAYTNFALATIYAFDPFQLSYQ
jgi:hypothetical protein